MGDFSEDVGAMVLDNRKEIIASDAAKLHIALATLEQELLEKKYALRLAQATFINTGKCDGKNDMTREALLDGFTMGEIKDVLRCEQAVVYAKAKLEAVRWAKQLVVASLGGNHDD